MMQRQPKPWWWIPASEHPGQTEQKRSWEIMSAIDGYIETTAQNGVLTLKDDKTYSAMCPRIAFDSCTRWRMSMSRTRCRTPC